MKITKLVGYGNYLVETGRMLADGREIVSNCTLDLKNKTLKTTPCAKGEINLCPTITVKLDDQRTLDVVRNLAAGEAFTGRRASCAKKEGK